MCLRELPPKLANKQTGEEEIEPHIGMLFAGPDQRAAFIAKFGREPTEDDPWFFDPDAATPQPYAREAVKSGTAKICQWMLDELQTDPEDHPDAPCSVAIIYASERRALYWISSATSECPSMSAMPTMMRFRST